MQWLNTWKSRLREKQLESIEKSKYRNDTGRELKEQASSLAPIVAFICIFVWLDFALSTDPVLHPEFIGLVYFRYGLSALGAFCWIIGWIPQLKKHRYLLLYLLAAYATISCSFFTGRIADDPNYVSGFQLLLMLVSLVPARFFLLGIMYLLSASIFVTSVLIYTPDLSSKGAHYSMNNLLIAYVFAVVFAYFMNQSRIGLFFRHLQVRQLKEKQDGDYFLTSRLVQPLISIEVDSAGYGVGSFLRQFKSFQFKKWDSEIGGDFVAAYNVELKGKSFIALVNADAMGKSLQGAAGALVFGTVYKSFINRTWSSDYFSDEFPEQWLKKCFLDLQSSFVTFDGSMLVSAVLGLLEESTGTLYFLNAEHPVPVLFRDGKASFLPESGAMRKLGVEMEGAPTLINAFTMQEGDRIIIGSDGRDDIELTRDVYGNRDINEDEMLFLSAVEAGKGDLDLIVRELESLGKIIDDLSFIEISKKERAQSESIYPSERFHQWMGEARQLLEDNKWKEAEDLLLNIWKEGPKTIEIVRSRARIAERQGFLEDSLQILKDGMQYITGDPDLFYTISITSKKLYVKTKKASFLEQATDYAERCFLRNPYMAKNLVNLTNLYSVRGQSDKAKYFLNLLKETDPDNSNISTLKSSMGI